MLILVPIVHFKIKWIKDSVLLSALGFKKELWIGIGNENYRERDLFESLSFFTKKTIKTQIKF